MQNKNPANNEVKKRKLYSQLSCTVSSRSVYCTKRLNKDQAQSFLFNSAFNRKNSYIAKIQLAT